MYQPADVMFEISKKLTPKEFDNLSQADPDYLKIMDRYLQHWYQSHLAVGPSDWGRTHYNEITGLWEYGSSPSKLRLDCGDHPLAVLKEGLFRSLNSEEFIEDLQSKMGDYYDSHVLDLPFKLFYVKRKSGDKIYLFIERDILAIELAIIRGSFTPRTLWNHLRGLILDKYWEKLEKCGYVIFSDILPFVKHVSREYSGYSYGPIEGLIAYEKLNLKLFYEQTPLPFEEPTKKNQME